MKKKNRILNFIMAVLISFSFLSYFIGKQDKVVYASPSINNIISKEEIMDKYYEVKKDKQELMDMYNELNRELLSEKEIMIKIKVIGSSVLIVYSMGICIYVKKYIKDKIEELSKNKINGIIEKEMTNKIDNEISKQFTVNEGHIKKMIKECSREEYLIKNKKILVISKDDDDEYEIRSLLKQFKEIETVKLNCKHYNLSNYDVIFFNDISGNIDKDEMIKIIEENDNNKAVYMYFNKTRKLLDYKKNQNINFATNNVTVSGNLLDLMKYQDDILNDRC